MKFIWTGYILELLLLALIKPFLSNFSNMGLLAVMIHATFTILILISFKSKEKILLLFAFLSRLGFQAMDVFVFPSLFEGLPVTLIEAQGSGLKCFISDSITHEVRITELIDFISLDKSPNYWANEVLKYGSGYERKDASFEIRANGYDIEENAKWLENFYLEHVNKLRENY